MMAGYPAGGDGWKWEVVEVEESPGIHPQEGVALGDHQQGVPQIQTDAWAFQGHLGLGLLGV